MSKRASTARSSIDVFTIDCDENVPHGSSPSSSDAHFATPKPSDHIIDTIKLSQYYNAFLATLVIEWILLVVCIIFTVVEVCLVDVGPELAVGALSVALLLACSLALFASLRKSPLLLLCVVLVHFGSALVLLLLLVLCAVFWWLTPEGFSVKVNPFLGIAALVQFSVFATAFAYYQRAFIRRVCPIGSESQLFAVEKLAKAAVETPVCENDGQHIGSLFYSDRPQSTLERLWSYEKRDGDAALKAGTPVKTAADGSKETAPPSSEPAVTPEDCCPPPVARFHSELLDDGREASAFRLPFDGIERPKKEPVIEFNPYALPPKRAAVYGDSVTVPSAERRTAFRQQSEPSRKTNWDMSSLTDRLKWGGIGSTSSSEESICWKSVKDEVAYLSSHEDPTQNRASSTGGQYRTAAQKLASRFRSTES